MLPGRGNSGGSWPPASPRSPKYDNGKLSRPTSSPVPQYKNLKNNSLRRQMYLLKCILLNALQYYSFVIEFTEGNHEPLRGEREEIKKMELNKFPLAFEEVANSLKSSKLEEGNLLNK